VPARTTSHISDSHPGHRLHFACSEKKIKKIQKKKEEEEEEKERIREGSEGQRRMLSHSLLLFSFTFLPL
jgi:hypothetical protein